MSPYLYRRLMREKLAQWREHSGASIDQPARRSLDQGTADGLAGTLEWNPATYGLRIAVVDCASEPVTFAGSAADASDAFVEPFICAGRVVCEVV